VPRPLRIELPGALHHVSWRALERSPLFRDDADRERFLEDLGRTAAERGWVVHAYSLLGSSVEVLLETPNPNLSAGMRALGGRYAQAFNRRHGRGGPLFEGRFRSLLVDPENAFLDAARSVALAPVRARLSRTALEWRWSSAPATAGRAERPSWLTVDATLRRLSPLRPRARQRFEGLVSDARGIRPLRERAASGGVVGSPEFAHRVRLRLLAGPNPGEKLPRGAVELPRVRAAVASRFGVAEADLARPDAHEAKVAAIWLSRRLTGLSGREVGAAFGVGQARVSNVLGDVRAGRWKALRPALDEMEKGLLAENE
jgi:REP element-mobilizing transposase RayT